MGLFSVFRSKAPETPSTSSSSKIAKLADDVVTKARGVLENTREPGTRLDVVFKLLGIYKDDAHPGALNEILETLKNDATGEVVIAAAFSLANLPAACQGDFQKVLFAAFEQSGDRNTVNAAPLLRIAYVAAFRGDVETLDRMERARPGANGGARILKAMELLKAKDTDRLYRLMAWSEGLDAKYRPDLFDRMPVDKTTLTEFRRRLTTAVESVRSRGEY